MSYSDGEKSIASCARGCFHTEACNGWYLSGFNGDCFHLRSIESFQHSFWGSVSGVKNTYQENEECKQVIIGDFGFY